MQILTLTFQNTRDSTQRRVANHAISLQQGEKLMMIKKSKTQPVHRTNNYKEDNPTQPNPQKLWKNKILNRLLDDCNTSFFEVVTAKFDLESNFSRSYDIYPIIIKKKEWQSSTIPPSLAWANMLQQSPRLHEDGASREEVGRMSQQNAHRV